VINLVTFTRFNRRFNYVYTHYCTDPDVTWGVEEAAPYLCSIGRICNRDTGCVAMVT